MGETITHAYYKEKGMPVKIIRIFHTYGPGMNLNDGRVVMDFTRELVKNKKIVIKSSGKQKRSFCYIADMVSAILIVLLNGKNGEAYNAANPREFYSISSLAKKIQKIFPNTKILYKNRDFKESYTPSPLNKVYPDIKKIIDLGFNPKIDIQNGFKRTLKFFQK